MPYETDRDSRLEFADSLLLPKRKTSETKEERKTVKVIGEPSKFITAEGRTVGGLICKCLPKDRTEIWLTEQTPLLAREVHFQYSYIKWQAGKGWPTYYVPEPLNYLNAGAVWPKYPFHCIVWELGGETFHTGDPQGAFRGQKESTVLISVNDTVYVDNEGLMVIIITAYTPN